jgi:hypothetical protein
MTGFMVSNSQGSQGVEFSSLHIRYELPVPQLRIELCKPSAEQREFFGRHPLNFGFNLLNSTHILTRFISMVLHRRSSLSRQPPDYWCDLLPLLLIVPREFYDAQSQYAR